MTSQQGIATQYIGPEFGTYEEMTLSRTSKCFSSLPSVSPLSLSTSFCRCFRSFWAWLWSKSQHRKVGARSRMDPEMSTQLDKVR